MPKNSVGIGVRMPLTNSYVELEEYRENRPLLEKYHREGNAVIVTNDDLARWIREDFPEYRIEASVIKNINSYQGIEEAFNTREANSSAHRRLNTVNCTEWSTLIWKSCLIWGLVGLNCCAQNRQASPESGGLQVSDRPYWFRPAPLAPPFARVN